MIIVVASGAPGVPVVSCAAAAPIVRRPTRQASRTRPPSELVTEVWNRETIEISLAFCDRALFASGSQCRSYVLSAFAELLWVKAKIAQPIYPAEEG